MRLGPAERELLISRICSGSVRIAVRGKPILYRLASRDKRYEASELYQEVFLDSEIEGLYSDGELLEFLVDNSLWDADREKLLNCLPKEIDQFKHSLYKATYRSKERRTIRKALERAREHLGKLTAERHAYDHLSCSGAAAVAKSRFLVAHSLFYPDGRPVFTRGSFWELDDIVVGEAMEQIAHKRLGDVVFRELARTEPWRSTWACRSAEKSTFGIPPVDYTEEQRSLTGWSSLYENVTQHPECPNEEVIADDDLLDGWLIEQRKSRGGNGPSEKLPDAHEVYLMADTEEDARKVDDLNDRRGSLVKKQRMQYLLNSGVVKELDMPDQKQRIQMELNSRARPKA